MTLYSRRLNEYNKHGHRLPNVEDQDYLELSSFVTPELAACSCALRTSVP